MQFDSNQNWDLLADCLVLIASAPAHIAFHFSYSADSERDLDPVVAQHRAMTVSVASTPLRHGPGPGARGRALVPLLVLCLVHFAGADDEFVGAGQSSWQNLIGQDLGPSDADFDFEAIHARHLALSYTFSKFTV